MIRIAKLTDYAFTLLTHFASAPEKQVLAAAELASVTKLPLPTVTKILKLLARGGVLHSHRGVHGGYSLAGRPEDISVVQVIAALDGPIALTECLTGVPGACDYEPNCLTIGAWQQINGAVQRALEGITLEEITSAMSRQAAILATPRSTMESLLEV